MTIVEVNDKKTRKEFLLLPRSLYKSDPNFISPLDKEIESVFDPKHNHFHNHGICKRWILKNDSITVGRIAAFINFEKNKIIYHLYTMSKNYFITNNINIIKISPEYL